MLLESQLWVCTSGGSNKYYLVVGNGDDGCDVYYGRLQALEKCNFSNHYVYSRSVDAQMRKKMTGWRRKSEDYQQVFYRMVVEQTDAFDIAVEWARSGELVEAKKELVGAVSSGWFNNGE